MAGVVSDVKIIISALKTLYDLGKSIQGNYHRCDLLIQRCSIFEDELAKIDKNSSHIAINSKALNKLHEVIEDCIKFVRKYGGNNWKSICLQLSNAKGIETEFFVLNESLHQACSDLSLTILFNSAIFRDETNLANREDLNASIDVSRKFIRL
jgi:hypothetical protein